jgi:RecA-family ATPase
MAILPMKQFSILAGASGAGKTTLLLQAWLAHESGEDFPIQFDKAITSVGIIITDRTKGEVEDRIRTLGIKHAEVYGLADDPTLPLSLLDRTDQLFSEAFKRFEHKHRLYFIDPIMLFMEGSSIDYKQVARSLIRFNRFVVQHDICMVGTHHATKARSDFRFHRPQDRISGSAAFQGYSGTQMVLIEGLEDNNDYDQLVLVPHTSPKEEFRLVRREDGYFSVQQQAGVKALANIFTQAFIKLSEFKSKAALAGVTDNEITRILEEESGFKLGPKGYVVRANQP